MGEEESGIRGIGGGAVFNDRIEKRGGCVESHVSITINPRECFAVQLKGEKKRLQNHIIRTELFTLLSA